MKSTYEVNNMKTKTHTPGPWNIVWDGHCTAGIMAKSISSIFDRGIATCDGGYSNFEEDVRLIAQAPDMAKEIEELKAQLDKSLAAMEYVRKAMSLDRKDHDEYLVISEAINQARVIIAKCGGK